MGATQPAIESFGPVMQLGYVVRDLTRALEFWTKTLRVGPFFRIEHVPFSGSKYLGQGCSIDISTAFGYWKDMQIELIEQHNAAPSVFRSWTDTEAVGVHHVCVKVPDVESARARCDSLGAQVLQEAWMTGAGHFIYADLGGGQGLVEFAELDPSFDRLFAYMHRAAAHWSGDDPVRAIPPPEQWHS
jgi:methylmalonyl-CoA/ethylmalonyl-CoA epimerase